VQCNSIYICGHVECENREDIREDDLADKNKENRTCGLGAKMSLLTEADSDAPAKTPK
jgi:hypothetical protein